MEHFYLVWYSYSVLDRFTENSSKQIGKI